MSDLVKALRDLAELLSPANTSSEAGLDLIAAKGADEIERLRSICNGTIWEENERLRSQLVSMQELLEEARDQLEGSEYNSDVRLAEKIKKALFELTDEEGK